VLVVVAWLCAGLASPVVAMSLRAGSTTGHRASSVPVYASGIGDAVSIEATPTGRGLLVLGRNGAVRALGDAPALGSATLPHPAVAVAVTRSGAGYWVFDANGCPQYFGDAAHFAQNICSLHLQGPVLDAATTPDGQGYWLVASDGGIFAFGDAPFLGSMGGRHLSGAVVGMAPGPSGSGYWEVAADGGIFSFGVPFRGSMGGTPLHRPVVGMVASGSGYLMVAADGGVFNFGNPFFGSLGGQPPAQPIVAIAPSFDISGAPNGYWMIDASGNIYTFGQAWVPGSVTPPPPPTTTPTPTTTAPTTSTTAPSTTTTTTAAGPVITAVQVTAITTSSATVTWTTDVASTSQVLYGQTPAYGSSTTASSTPVTSHSQAISGLSSGNQYDFAVRSIDGGGHASTSSNATFVTTLGVEATTGQWGSDLSWPLVAVHANLLHNGKMLLWDGWQTPTPAVLYDPGAQTFTTVSSASGLFCSGVVELADGRVLVAGGHDQASGFTETGVVDTNIFDPATNTWTKVANMHFARWYPSLTLLADGRVLALSGQSTPGVWVDTPEVYDPVANTWTLLNSVATSQVREDEYPLTFQLPSGKVLVIAPSTGGTFLLDVNAPTWTSLGASSVINGSAAMYAPGKILYSGGGDASSGTNPAAANAQILDTTVASPAWAAAHSMSAARYEQTMVDLPDGNVFAMGGAGVTSQTTSNDVLSTETWNPLTNTWTALPAQAEGRIYHSTAVLQPDGRVLVAGGGRYNGAADHLSAQYYSPPYLFEGARPAISSAPASATFGSTITVTTPAAASIGSVYLIDLATDTHTQDQSQRRVPLSFTAGSSSLSVQLPAAASAPPGYYMLFITNSSGVPSTAAMIQVSSVAIGASVPLGAQISVQPAFAAASAAASAASAVTVPVPAAGVTPVLAATGLPPTAGVTTADRTGVLPPARPVAGTTVLATTATVSGQVSAGGGGGPLLSKRAVFSCPIGRSRAAAVGLQLGPPRGPVVAPGRRATPAGRVAATERVPGRSVAIGPWLVPALLPASRRLRLVQHQ